MISSVAFQAAIIRVQSQSLLEVKVSLTSWWFSFVPGCLNIVEQLTVSFCLQCYRALITFPKDSL